MIPNLFIHVAVNIPIPPSLRSSYVIDGFSLKVLQITQLQPGGFCSFSSPCLTLAILPGDHLLRSGRLSIPYSFSLSVSGSTRGVRKGTNYLSSIIIRHSLKSLLG